MSAAMVVPAFGVGWRVNESTRGSVEAPRLSLDGQQLGAARGHDPTAFEALVRRHQGPVFNFCLRMLGQSEDAADVAQETFVQLYSHLSRDRKSTRLNSS